jgi:hypothetical protein
MKNNLTENEMYTMAHYTSIVMMIMAICTLIIKSI